MLLFDTSAAFPSLPLAGTTNPLQNSKPLSKSQT
jgi:hypothetical protein